MFSYKVLTNTEHEISAETWTKSYLKSIGSSSVVHSIRTGKHLKFIMYNIRNMDICKELHEDYFNDSTIYINLDEKSFQYGVIGFHVIKRYGFGNP